MFNIFNLPTSIVSSQIKLMKENEDIFPTNKTETIMGGDGQPVDFSSTKNSWNLVLDEVTFAEFAEVQIINAWAPFFLCGKLKELMKKSPNNDKYIVNVTAVEGIFNQFKTCKHPHTNMAKASLNMMTRTSGGDYKEDGIYMTCVDTGWVSAMREYANLSSENSNKHFEEEYVNVPLDDLDGAMRNLHPILEGILNGKYLFGCLLRNYQVSNW